MHEQLIIFEQLKPCFNCKVPLPRTREFFTSEPRNSDGLRGVCNSCRKKSRRLEYRPESDEKKSLRNAKQRAMYQVESEVQREARRARSRKWKRENAEYIAEYTAMYRNLNIQWARLQVRRRRALIKNAPGFHIEQDVQRIYEQQGGKCAYCFAELNEKYDVDHIVPLSRGGSDWPDNICCACRHCNARKSTKTGEEFKQLLRKEGD